MDFQKKFTNFKNDHEFSKKKHTRKKFSHLKEVHNIKKIIDFE